MPRVFRSFFFSILAAAMLAYLSGCQDHLTAKTDKQPDEAGMKMILRGTWILQEYEDSIDAGLTPKLLQYMLERLNKITYTAGNRMEVEGIFDARELGRFWDDGRKADSSSVSFMPSSHKMILTIAEHANYSTPVIDTAEFVISGDDTVLHVYNDSASINLVKYDAGACRNVGAYEHLINSRFIAGKYYNLNDTARKRHIIFTKCGNIEGASNISPDLRDVNGYATTLNFNNTGPDYMHLYNDKDLDAKGMNDETKVRIMSWEVLEDSLILRYLEGQYPPIVLVKGR